ncbi:MAG: fibronectin type III domain-containing protein, partial [Spirochaetota bacterium]
DNERTGLYDLKSEWQPFIPGQPFKEEVRGRFIQFMLELLPDGYGKQSPSVHRLSFTYEPDLPPPPPSRLTASSGDKSIILKWKQVPESDVKGYLVYYGERPGQYFGTGSSLGNSPIDAGNTTSLALENLENGRLYYFAVAAYDSSVPPHISALSKEVSARPSRFSKEHP